LCTAVLAALGIFVHCSFGHCGRVWLLQTKKKER